MAWNLGLCERVPFLRTSSVTVFDWASHGEVGLTLDHVKAYQRSDTASMQSRGGDLAAGCFNATINQAGAYAVNITLESTSQFPNSHCVIVDVVIGLRAGSCQP
jgi:hypothetical protein